MQAKVKRPWGLQCLFGFSGYSHCGKCGQRIYGYPKFCGKCGSELEWTKCPSCGSLLGASDKLYCEYCGRKLGEPHE